MKYGLVPLSNFGVIEERMNIVRHAQPLYAYQYEWLRDVAGIKTIINLRAEAPLQDAEHCVGIKCLHINVQDHHPPTLEQVRHFIELIRNSTDTSFHCEHGHGRTSTFSVIAKMALGMSFEQAMQHERDVFLYHFKHQVQLDFLNQNKTKLAMLTRAKVVAQTL